MSTLREDFEAWATLHGADVAPFLLPANIYASQDTRMLWLACQWATERAAKLCDEQGEYHSDFKNTQAAIGCDGCAAAIRSGGEAGS